MSSEEWNLQVRETLYCVESVECHKTVKDSEHDRDIMCA